MIAPALTGQEPPKKNKKRKVSLGSLLGKVKKEKEEDKTPEMDELERVRRGHGCARLRRPDPRLAPTIGVG